MQAAHRRMPVTEFKGGLTTLRTPGTAMGELEVLAMNQWIHIVQTKRAAALEGRAAARATRVQDSTTGFKASGISLWYMAGILGVVVAV